MSALKLKKENRYKVFFLQKKIAAIQTVKCRDPNIISGSGHYHILVLACAMIDEGIKI